MAASDETIVSMQTAVLEARRVQRTNDEIAVLEKEVRRLGGEATERAESVMNLQRELSNQGQEVQHARSHVLLLAATAEELRQRVSEATGMKDRTVQCLQDELLKKNQALGETEDMVGLCCSPLQLFLQLLCVGLGSNDRVF